MIAQDNAARYGLPPHGEWHTAAHLEKILPLSGPEVRRVLHSLTAKGFIERAEDAEGRVLYRADFTRLTEPGVRKGTDL